MAVYANSTTNRGVISCDWLALSCLLASPRDDKPLVPPAGWHCILMTPTAVWGERWFVLDEEGNKVATILCKPRSHIIDCKRCVVEIANRWLYFDNLHDIIDRVCDIVPMSIEGLNRVDLCCDFEMSKEYWRTYQMLSCGDAYIKALRSGSVWWQTLTTETSKGKPIKERVPHCITFGGKESTFKWKVYYKYLELQQAPPEGKKPYIFDLWRYMGFDESKVWRVEVSISGSNSLCSMNMEKILPLKWFDDRVRLFCDIYSDKFVIRADEGHADKRNDKVLPFLAIDGEKSVRHALPRSSHDDSDPEKRLTCKLWRELQQTDVQCNKGLCEMLQSSLMELCQRPSNVWALQRVYGVDIETIAREVSRET